MFGEMRREFERQFTAGGERFAHVRLTHRFARRPACCRLSTRCSRMPSIKADSSRRLDVWMPHEALKKKLPGLVEIWPPVGAKRPRDDARDWRLPLDILDEMDPRERRRKARRAEDRAAARGGFRRARL